MFNKDTTPMVEFLNLSSLFIFFIEFIINSHSPIFLSPDLTPLLT